MYWFLFKFYNIFKVITDVEIFIYFQNGFKQDSLLGASSSNQNTIPNFFDSKTAANHNQNLNHVSVESSNPKPGSADLKPGLSTQIQDPKQSGSSYSNQWTVSGDKKPVLDPSLEAAKYWQRIKEQGFFPGNHKSADNNKDQQAVESTDEFSEFNHNFANFQHFPSQHPVVYDTQPPIPFQHHHQEPPHIVYERDHAGTYERGPTGNTYGHGPIGNTNENGPSVSYEHRPTISYDPIQTISYDSDEDGPEKNALIYLSPHGPKVNNFGLFMASYY